jgi:hypothetical protein
MPFALQLLRVVISVGQQRRDVEHDLAVPEDVVHSLFTRLSKLCVQTSAIPDKKDNKNKL